VKARVIVILLAAAISMVSAFYAVKRNDQEQAAKQAQQAVELIQKAAALDSDAPDTDVADTVQR
jgi:type II secretory pathway pseudopilin PulG